MATYGRILGLLGVETQSACGRAAGDVCVASVIPVPKENGAPAGFCWKQINISRPRSCKRRKEIECESSAGTFVEK